MLQRLGSELAQMFDSAEMVLGCPEMRAEFATLFVAKGGNPANVPSYWQRILYIYAFPGQGKANGKFYTTDKAGKPVLDVVRNVRDESPLGHVGTLPRVLKKMPYVSPADLVHKAMVKAPLRAIVCATGNSGKTVLVAEMVESILDQGLCDWAYILTGTTAGAWERINCAKGQVRVRYFEGNLDELTGLIEDQKSSFRATKDASWTNRAVERPLIVLDDLGDVKGMDSLFMTLRNFNVSTIAINQDPHNFLTPTRRSNATVVCVSDLTNPGRLAVLETLALPPKDLSKNDWLEFCAHHLGRVNGYKFFVFNKEVGELCLTCATTKDTAVAALDKRLASLGLEDAEQEEEDEPLPPAGGGGGAAAAQDSAKKRHPQQKGKQLGGGNDTDQDLYTTQKGQIEPLLEVLLERHPGATIWEPCQGLGDITTVLEAGGFSVVSSDLYSPDGKTIFPDKSFVSFTHKHKDTKEVIAHYDACPVPEGVDVIVSE